MSLIRIQELHREITELSEKRRSHEELLEEQGGGLSEEQTTDVQRILTQWNEKENDLRTKIGLLMPQAAQGATQVMKQYYEVTEAAGGLQKPGDAERPFTQAVGSRVIRETETFRAHFSGSNRKRAEAAQRAADTLAELCELEEQYPALGRLVLDSLGHLRATLDVQPAEVPSPAAEPSSTQTVSNETQKQPASTRNALMLIGSDKETALKIIHGSSPSVASDLIELKETHPHEVMTFLRKLQPDAREEIFEAGLPLEHAGSLFLFDIPEVARQIGRQFKEDKAGRTSNIYALSTLAMLIEEAEEALSTVHMIHQGDSVEVQTAKEHGMQEAQKRIGHVFGVLSALGCKRVRAMAEYDYGKRKTRGGDIHHAEEGSEAVLAFLNAYEEEIVDLGREIEEVEVAQPVAGEKVAAEETITPADRMQELAEQKAGQVIEEAKVAFEKVDIDE